MICDLTNIRLTTVYCCAEIVKPFIRIHECVESLQKKEVYLLIKNVLECLVKVAVGDSNFEVRLSVLKCFSSMERDFLMHLAQSEILKILFLTLADENFKIREQAVELMGQLADINPALVFPKLRGVVKNNISYLAESGVAKNEEHGARMIAKMAIYVKHCFSLKILFRRRNL